VAEKLSDWLAGRGRKLGGGHVTGSEDEGSGVGSGILSRFSVAPPLATPLPTPASSETLSSSDRDTKKLYGPDTVGEDEEIGLAPLEDDSVDIEAPKKRKTPSSDVLASSSAPGVAQPARPKKTIFEEEFAEEENDPIRARAAEKSKAQYDPLHPPGYVSPFERSRTWLWVLLGVSGFVGIGFLLTLFV
ncbi:MAG: hypothetical protein AAF790_15470, partial [Planctomycetota bacterium]